MPGGDAAIRAAVLQFGVGRSRKGHFEGGLACDRICLGAKNRRPESDGEFQDPLSVGSSPHESGYPHMIEVTVVVQIRRPKMDSAALNLSETTPTMF